MPKVCFSEPLESCLRKGLQVVTRRGIEAAVLIPVDDWRGLREFGRPTLPARYRRAGSTHRVRANAVQPKRAHDEIAMRALGIDDADQFSRANIINI